MCSGIDVEFNEAGEEKREREIDDDWKRRERVKSCQREKCRLTASSKLELLGTIFMFSLILPSVTD